MRLSKILRRILGAAAPAQPAPRDADEEEEDGVDPFDPFPQPVRLEITDVFDLHTIRPGEVRAVVEEYLREARRKGFRVVRIVHGKGVGVQREIVRSVLARTPFVEHFSDAPPEAGGWGATVARFSSGGEKANPGAED